MLNKKIILTLFVCGIAAFQATAQTAGNVAAKPTEQHGQALGIVGKPRSTAAQGSENTQQPAMSGNANRPVQPATANPNGAATVVSTPGNPNGKVKTAPKN